MQSIGPTAIADMTLPVRFHLSDDMLFTMVRMCSRCAILGANRCRCVTYAASYNFFMVRSLPGLTSMRRWSLVTLSTANIETFHSQVGLRHTPIIISRGASVAAIHVGLSGRISLRWVSKLARDANRCFHRLSSSWTAECDANMAVCRYSDRVL